MKILMSFLKRYYSILLILAAWEAISRAGIGPVRFIPPVTIIARHSLNLIIDGSLLIGTAVTIARALSGLGLGIIVGVGLGVMMARWAKVAWLLDPYIAAGFSTPKITLIPVFILWFGIGHLSKVLLISFACFFPVVVSTYAGAKTVNHLLIWSAKSLGTSEKDMLRKVVVPAALPFIFNGVRVALPLSLIIVIVAEMMAGGGGLGFLMMNSFRYFEIPTQYSALLSVLILGYGFDRLLLRLRSWVLEWQEEEH